MKKLILLLSACLLFSGCHLFPSLYSSTMFNSKITKLDANITSDLDYPNNMKEIKKLREEIKDKKQPNSSLRQDIRKLRKYSCNLNKYNNRFNKFLEIAMYRPDIDSVFSSTLDDIRKKLKADGSIQDNFAISGAPSKATIRLVDTTLSINRARKVKLGGSTPQRLTDSITSFIQDSTLLSNLNKIKRDTIGYQPIQISLTAFSNSTTPDSYAAGSTQYYMRGNMPLIKPFGMIRDSSTGLRNWPFPGHIIPFRSVLLQITYDPKPTNMQTDSVNHGYLANRLDLIQNAQWNITSSVNLFTIIFTDKGSYHDCWHLYLDVVGGMAFTKDSIQKQPSQTITTLISGLHLKVKSKFKSPFQFEVGTQLLWFNPHSSSISPGLNVQYRNIKDTALLQNSGKPISIGNQVYWNFDGLLTYNINFIKGSGSSFAYAHFDAYTNDVIHFASHHYYPNNYFQIQLGYSLDLMNLLSDLIPSSSSSK